jgi:predicted MFS family arabinose efflux permease
VISRVGDGLGLFGFPVLIETLTNQSFWVALVYPMFRVPWVLAPSIGGYVDRLDARQVMIRTEVLRGLILVIAVAAATIGSSLPVLFISILLLGIGECAFNAAAMRAIPLLVQNDQLADANGRIMASTGAAEQVGGFALGGPMVAAGRFVPLLADGVSFFLSAHILRGLPDLPPSANDSPPIKLQAMFRTSLRWIAAKRPLVVLTAFVCVMSLAQGLQFGSFPVFVRRQLGLSKAEFGIFAAILGIGGIFGAAVAARVWRKVHTHRLLPLVAAIAGTTYAVAGVTTNFLIAGFALFLESVAVTVAVVCAATLRMQLIPGHLVGRVGNTIRTLSICCQVVGGLVSAAMVRHFEPGAALIVAAGFCAFAVIAMVRPLQRSFPEVRS